MKSEKGNKEAMTIPIYRPYVFLRCGKCGRKTDHVLISVETQKNSGKSHLEEIYECQRCGEVKRIYELTTWTIHSPSQYSRQEGLKETEEPMEVTVKDVPASPQPKKTEEQKEKKKRKWL